MLSDLDSQMRRKRIQAIVVIGDTTLANPDLTYVAGGALPRGGVYFKRVGERPLLVVSNLDVGNARKLGRVRRINTYTDWGFEKLARKYGRQSALPHLIAAVLRTERTKGRVGIYGRNDLAFGINLADQLKKLGISATGESSPTVLEAARETKEHFETNELRRVSRKTSRIVRAAMDALRNMNRKRGRIFIKNKLATVASVKRMISHMLAEEGLTAPEGTIFAIGARSADPHNAGDPADEIREKRLIVFDIFPQAESGYWSDVTRTFVLGRADERSRRLFETVCEAQAGSLDFLRAGVTGEVAMSRACDIIERRGYRTVRDVFKGTATSVTSGFTHSLGHGVGLTIGERPYLSFLSRDRLKAGQVVTVEPGVYVPGFGGVRIEDTVVITPRGIDNLVNVPKEFELT